MKRLKTRRKETILFKNFKEFYNFVWKHLKGQQQDSLTDKNDQDTLEQWVDITALDLCGKWWSRIAGNQQMQAEFVRILQNADASQKAETPH